MTGDALKLSSRILVANFSKVDPCFITATVPFRLAIYIRSSAPTIDEYTLEIPRIRTGPYNTLPLCLSNAVRILSFLFKK